MATYYTAKAPSNGAGPTVGPGTFRGLVVLEAQVSCTSAMTDNTNDSVGLFYAPAGFVVIGGTISSDDMDSSTGIAWNIGDSGSNSRFFSASAVSQAATFSSALAPAGHFYKYTSRTEIRAYVQAAVSGTPATGTLKVALFGFIDPDYSTTALTAST